MHLIDSIELCALISLIVQFLVLTITVAKHLLLSPQVKPSYSELDIVILVLILLYVLYSN